MPVPGRFIVLEGLDGAGTTTQARLLTEWLRAKGRDVVQTAQPSPGPIGTFLRHVMARRVVTPQGERLTPAAIAGLFVADRADHLHTVIEPALARGADVICDRYVFSSLAYQGAEGDVDWIAQLNAPMRSPDLTVMVEVTAEVAASRRAGRGEAADLYEVDAFQRKVAAGYRAAPSLRPQDRVAVIDGSQSIDAVQIACRSAIENIQV